MVVPPVVVPPPPPMGFRPHTTPPYSGGPPGGASSVVPPSGTPPGPPVCVLLRLKDPNNQDGRLPFHLLNLILDPNDLFPPGVGTSIAGRAIKPHVITYNLRAMAPKPLQHKVTISLRG